MVIQTCTKITKLRSYLVLPSFQKQGLGFTVIQIQVPKIGNVFIVRFALGCEGKTGKERNLVIFKDKSIKIATLIESSRRDLFIDIVV